jgi:CubicO group peptidase (beta-lactamase class C family)
MVERRAAEDILEKDIYGVRALGALRPFLSVGVGPTGPCHASIGGFFGRSAGLSGTGDVQLEPTKLNSHPPSRAATPKRFAHKINPSIQTAIADATSAHRQPADTIKAVVVVCGNDIIAETYGEGIGPKTLILGYSLTKLLASVIAGRLYDAGLIDPTSPLFFEEARRVDQSSSMTLLHLLSMTSGLAFDETGSGFDRPVRMLFGEQKMAEFAARSRRIASPEQRWAYSSCSTLLAAHAMAAACGPLGGFGAMLQQLAEQADLGTVIVDHDHAGTPVLSSFGYMTAAGYASLGCLLRDKGKAVSGRVYSRIWHDEMVRPRLRSNYGLAVRRNDVECPAVDRLIEAPDDTLFARAFHGQMIAVVPSRDLVMVRLAAIRERGNASFARLLRTVLEKMH